MVPLNNFEHVFEHVFLNVKCPCFIEFGNRDISASKMEISPNNHEIQ